MTRLLHHTRLTILVAALALAGGALAAGSTPAAYAGSKPSITATGGDGYLSVGGSGFTPLGKVQVSLRVYNPLTAKWQLETKSTVTALGPHYVCHTYPFGTICGWNAGGQINTDIISQQGTVHVVADDLSTGNRSNVATTYVLPIP